MNLIFLGPPGVGKGTQANLICNKYDLLHLSTGDILRLEISRKTEILKSYDYTVEVQFLRKKIK